MFAAGGWEGAKMSKPSRRAGREEIKEQRRQKKQAEKELREKQQAEGLKPKVCASISNSKSKYEDVEEECDARMDAATEQFRLLRARLPVLLKRLSKIKDPRSPKKIKHTVTVLMDFYFSDVLPAGSHRRDDPSDV